MQLAVDVPVCRYFLQAVPDHPTGSRCKIVGLFHITGCRVIAVLSGHIEVLFGELRRCSQ